MKIQQLCNHSGLICEDFGYSGKIRKLPDIIKYSPQHLISDCEKVYLLYYKPSYDDRYIELNRQEINSIRMWNQNINSVLVFIFNYRMNRYTIFTTNDINKKIFTCKKETIDKFLFDNQDFKWCMVTDKLELKNYEK